MYIYVPKYIEVFHVVFDIPGHLEFYPGFSFPNLIPGYLDNFSVFLSGYLSLLSPSVGFSMLSSSTRMKLHAEFLN